ncbi:hypothetical protein J6TS2_33410 [Heyndrickxia sporothermodurans]|nr:hypothetical protein J6TS2_33410 [Heyndrickxia sporothermodurans]
MGETKINRRYISMTRRVVEHKYKGTDNELLQVVTVFEEGMNKQRIKKLNTFTINRFVPSGDRYDWKKSG